MSASIQSGEAPRPIGKHDCDGQRERLRVFRVQKDAKTKRTICDGVKSGLVGSSPGWLVGVELGQFCVWSRAVDSRGQSMAANRWSYRCLHGPPKRFCGGDNQTNGCGGAVLGWQAGRCPGCAVVCVVRACPCLFWKCSAAEICVTGSCKLNGGT